MRALIDRYLHPHRLGAAAVRQFGYVNKNATFNTKLDRTREREAFNIASGRKQPLRVVRAIDPFHDLFDDRAFGPLWPRRRDRDLSVAIRSTGRQRDYSFS